MGLLSEFFIASPDSLGRLNLEQGPFESGFPTLRSAGIENVKLGMLDAFVTGVSFEQTLDEMPVIREDDEGPWLFELRQSFVEGLTHLTEPDVAGMATRWGRTEEIQADAQEEAALRTLIAELRILAKQAMEQAQGVYFWMSL